MERQKIPIVLKTKKNINTVELKKTVDKHYELEKNIQEYIDNKINIIEIIETEAPNDEEYKKIIFNIYNKLIWKKIEKINNENKILELWNKLRPYQKE